MLDPRLGREVLQVLVAVMDADAPLTVSDIARATGHGARSVDVYIQPLVHVGLVTAHGRPPQYVFARPSLLREVEEQSSDETHEPLPSPHRQDSGGTRSLGQRSTNFSLLGSQAEHEDLFDAFFALMSFAGGIPLSVIAERVAGAPLPPTFRRILRDFELGDIGPGYAAVMLRMQDRDPVAVFRVFFASLSELDQDIVRSRFRQDPDTLESLADRHGLTREGVRQKALRIRKDFERLVTYRLGDSLLLIERLEHARSNIPRIVDVSDVRASLRPTLPMIGYLPDELHQPFFFLAFGPRTARSGDVVDDRSFSFVRFGNDPNWFVDERIRDRLVEVRDRALDSGLPTKELLDAVPALRQLSDARTFLAAMGLQEIDGEVTARRIAWNERAVRLLRQEGAPVDFDDIVQILQATARVRSLRNALLADDRIVRVDRDTFALAEWGLAAYSTVRDLMRQELEAAGGEARISEIRNRLTARFDIKASSIDAYAKGSEFVRVSPGVIRLRGEHEEVEDLERPLHSLRGCVRIGRRWALRVEVTASLLKGFSIQLPSGMGPHFGVPQGESATLSTDRSGDISVVRRGLQDNIGRLRWVAQEMGLGQGDVLFLRLPERRGGRISFSGLARSDIERANPRRRAALLLGQEDDLTLAIACSALGMPRGSRPVEVVDRLRSRGEEELAELVAEVLGEGSTGTIDSSDIARILGL
jgi:hypothetical protein